MCAYILPSPRRCPICCGIHPLRVVRLKGGRYASEDKLTFPETVWDVGYLIHLCFHPHPIKPTKAERTFKVRGENNLGPLGVLVRRCGPAGEDSPIPLLAGRLSSPQLRRRRNGNISVSLSRNIKYLRYRELRGQNEKGRKKKVRECKLDGRK